MKSTRVRELPPSERPREKMRFAGASSLSSAELLAILIRTGSNGESALDLAERVLALRPEGIAYLAEAIPEELETVPGIGPAKACQIVAALELGRRVATRPKEKRVRLETVDALAGLFMEEMRHLPREVFRVLHLNNKLEILAIQDVSVGDVTSSMANPREVFRDAIRRNASQIIVVHNHPSGDPEPSRSDRDVTRRLVETGALLGIPLVDHLIIGDGEYVSFAERGYLRKEK